MICVSVSALIPHCKRGGSALSSLWGNFLWGNFLMNRRGRSFELANILLLLNESLTQCHHWRRLLAHWVPTCCNSGAVFVGMVPHAQVHRKRDSLCLRGRCLTSLHFHPLTLDWQFTRTACTWQIVRSLSLEGNGTSQQLWFSSVVSWFHSPSKQVYWGHFKGNWMGIWPAWH